MCQANLNELLPLPFSRDFHGNELTTQNLAIRALLLEYSQTLRCGGSCSSLLYLVPQVLVFLFYLLADLIRTLYSCCPLRKECGFSEVELALDPPHPPGFDPSNLSGPSEIRLGSPGTNVPFIAEQVFCFVSVAVAWMQ